MKMQRCVNPDKVFGQMQTSMVDIMQIFEVAEEDSTLPQFSRRNFHSINFFSLFYNIKHFENLFTSEGNVQNYAV